eukprot:CAMPEP_0175785424 /NCGR_PEP_ID=MMETSP0097-20121207/79320_1 /TAXON_ID=311494 /ORGANISM="Alexandrium monilatum, Strain CCMP3105" /LENGTH=79 /DNA_ID=CAMNT_0017096333 /DNA_START=159 /DNA_END=394 /DNA_ORIENTATION=+
MLATHRGGERVPAQGHNHGRPDGAMEGGPQVVTDQLAAREDVLSLRCQAKDVGLVAEGGCPLPRRPLPDGLQQASQTSA